MTRFDDWGEPIPEGGNPVPENAGPHEPGHYERLREQQRRVAAELSFAESRRKAAQAPRTAQDARPAPERTITPPIDDSTARRLLARWRKTRP